MTRPTRTRRTRTIIVLAASSLLATGCTTTVISETAEPDAPTTEETVSTTTTASAPPVTTVATTTPPTTTAPETTTTVAATTTSAPTTTTPTTTTTAPPPPCTAPSTPGESLFAAASRAGVEVDPIALWAEHGFTDTAAGALIDVCPLDGLDAVTGSPQAVPSDRAIASARTDLVRRQQSHLNALFAGFGTPELAVDGISGRLTGQQLCAARVALGLRPTVDDMLPATDEQVALFAATALPTPATAPTDRPRWVLIERTCQVMFVGEGDRTVYVFPTSTGSAGYETREQDRSRVFRYNPALENGGWHDSTDFPVGVDNPLNGNLYKPLYFDLGQAIHGANNVPPTPESKGCARLRVGDQERLIAWLGLDGVLAETWRKDEIGLTVSVQGQFVGRST